MQLSEWPHQLPVPWRAPLEIPVLTTKGGLSVPHPFSDVSGMTSEAAGPLPVPQTSCQGTSHLLKSTFTKMETSASLIVAQWMTSSTLCRGSHPTF